MAFDMIVLTVLILICIDGELFCVNIANRAVRHSVCVEMSCNINRTDIPVTKAIILLIYVAFPL